MRMINKKGVLEEIVKRSKKMVGLTAVVGSFVIGSESYGAGAMTLAWQPSTTVGNNVTHYIIEAKKLGGNTVRIPAQTNVSLSGFCEKTITSLENNAVYRFCVYAANANASTLNGQISNPSAYILEALGTPPGDDSFPNLVITGNTIGGAPLNFAGDGSILLNNSGPLYVNGKFLSSCFLSGLNVVVQPTREGENANSISFDNETGDWNTSLYFSPGTNEVTIAGINFRGKFDTEKFKVINLNGAFDYDGGGLNNIEEVNQGKNPLDPSDDKDFLKLFIASNGNRNLFFFPAMISQLNREAGYIGEFPGEYKDYLWLLTEQNPFKQYNFPETKVHSGYTLQFSTNLIDWKDLEHSNKLWMENTTNWGVMNFTDTNDMTKIGFGAYRVLPPLNYTAYVSNKFRGDMVKWLDNIKGVADQFYGPGGERGIDSSYAEEHKDDIWYEEQKVLPSAILNMRDRIILGY
ncbi:MAG: fibronectin type III domain-containing protein [Nanoarchaeota archaeon]